MAKAHYESSFIFSKLKASQGTLEGNLTTSQYLETLDRYLDAALLAILKNTRYLESMVAGLIGWQEDNFRKRVSLLNKREFLPKALSWLLQTKETKVKTVQDLRLDRGVALLICHSFLAECKAYSDIANKLELDESDDLKVIHNTELRLLAPGGNLHHAIATVKRQAKLAAKYRGDVLSKYFRLAIMAAQRDYVNYFDCRISLDDMCCEYIMASARAIDKCDYEKGPLTTYIQSWFYTARSHCKRRYDFQNSENSDDSRNFENSKPTYDKGGSSVSVDLGYDDNNGSSPPGSDYEGLRSSVSANALTSTEGMDSVLAQTERNLTIRFLAKIADPIGLARKILGIEETLSIAEKKQLGINNC